MPSGTRNDVVADVMKVEILWTQNGVPAANILHFGYTGGTPNSDDLATLAAGAINPLWSGIKADYATSTILAGLKATDLSSLSGAVALIPFNSAGAGSANGAPAQCCVLVDWGIARRYRGGHPRTYFPALDVGNVMTPSTWQIDVLTDFNNAANAMFATAGVVTSGSITLGLPVNVSYVSGDAWRVTNVVDTILSASTSSLIRTQRRRVTATTY